jgi:hypothetical protein
MLGTVPCAQLLAFRERRVSHIVRLLTPEKKKPLVSKKKSIETHIAQLLAFRERRVSHVVRVLTPGGKKLLLSGGKREEK